MNIKFKSIIVDDEKASRDLIAFYLYRQKHIEIVGQCDNPTDAIKLIDQHSPDLVFLDIQMPEGSGFDVLTHYQHPTFKTIIITAFNEYAIAAVKLSAYDYLLKPLNRDLLEESILRYKGQIEHEQNSLSITDMVRSQTLDKLVLKTDGVFRVMQAIDIYYFRAEGAYTYIQCKDRRHVVSQNLKYFEDILPPEMFHRTHKSFIVNHVHVTEVRTGRSGEVTMTDGAKLQIASRRMSIFKHWYFSKLK